MRIAIISDVHGNLPALEAVLTDIKGRGADVTVNLGDCVTSPLWPKETFEALQSLAMQLCAGTMTDGSRNYPTINFHQLESLPGTPWLRSRDGRCTAYLPV